MKRLYAIPLFFLLVSAAWGCPACKEVVSSQTNAAAASKLSGGFAASLTILLSTPYLLFGGITFAIVRSAKRKNRPDAS